MKKKSNHDKAQEITKNNLKNNIEKINKDNKDVSIQFEAGEVFDSLDFSPDSWKKY